MLQLRTVQLGQSNIDLAIQHYGSIEGLFQLIKLGNLEGINDSFVPGTKLNIESDNQLNPEMVRYLERKQLSVNTKQQTSTTTDRQFDDSFDDSFG